MKSSAKLISDLFQVVFEEALDVSGLPRTLREEFELIEKLEGRYHVTSYVQTVEHKDPSTNQDPPCQHIQVIDPDVVRRHMDLSAVELVVAKEGMRWAAQLHRLGQIRKVEHMVLRITDRGARQILLSGIFPQPKLS